MREYIREKKENIWYKEILKLILDVQVRKEKRQTKVHVDLGSWTVHQIAKFEQIKRRK